MVMLDKAYEEIGGHIKHYLMNTVTPDIYACFQSGGKTQT
jgi:hypothetical protein